MTNTPTSNPITLMPKRRAGSPGADARPDLYDFSPDGLVEEMKRQGLPVFRGKQILQWLYKDIVTDFMAMTNLPLDLRRRLATQYRIGSAEIVTQQVSAEGDTRKVLLRFADGSTVETVLMLYYDRATVCVSSQVGCAMGCVFCATGQMGFTRNLSAGEMVEQVLIVSRWLREHPYTPPAPPAPPAPPRAPLPQGRPMPGRPPGPPGRGPQDRRPYPAQGRGPARMPVPPSSFQSRSFVPPPPGPLEPPKPLDAVTNVVFMGMGEPMVNYDNLWQAIHTLNSPDGLVLGARRMTVSTVGVVPRIRRFAREELPVNLAISLHAPNDELRRRLVPLDEKYPLPELMDACRDYIAITKRRLTFEYALIAGENDSVECAEQLGQLLKGMLVHVNLIPLNPIPGTGLKATPREQVRAFATTVERYGVPCTVRIERGQDIAAACGQLKVQHEPGSHQRSLNPTIVDKEAPEPVTIPAHDV